MKNIHILPTDKPSRLHLWTNEKGTRLELCDLKYSHTRNTQNIYITNDEEIKEGDYSFYPPFGVGKNIVIDGELCFYIEAKNGKGSFTQRTYQTLDRNKKIILTIDSDLIRDGVQSIDNEFLQWFVNNSSCENVEIENIPDFIYQTNHACYKIIIQKEEPKPHSFCETPNEKCTMNYCDENGCINRKRELVNIIQNKTNLEKLPFTKLFKEFAEYYKNVSLVEETKQGRTYTNNCSVVCGECQIFDKEPITKEKPCKHFTQTIGCIKDICLCENNPEKSKFKHLFNIISKEEILSNRSNAFGFIDFNKRETLEDITEQLQNECHKFVESLPNINYQDGTNLFLFMKLAELTLKIKK